MAGERKRAGTSSCSCITVKEKNVKETWMNKKQTKNTCKEIQFLFVLSKVFGKDGGKVIKTY